MKILYLCRHAKSSWADPGMTDFERPLNERGLQNAPMMARLFKRRNEPVDLLVSSTAVRALSTARLFADELGIPEKQIKKEPAIYEASVPAILNVPAACDPEEPNRTHPIQLSLTQSGNTVNGHVRISSRDIPVTGRIDGQGVTLAGVLEEGRPATAITRWAATLDKLGRMRGTFSYVTTYSSRQFAYDSVELWSVVLRP